MFAHKSSAFSLDPALTGKVWALIVGRLILFTLIIMAGWWWSQSGNQESLSSNPYGLRLLLLALIPLTVLYSFWLKFSRTALWHIRLQFLIDTLLITWLVLETGELISPYVTLYVILISVAGFFIGRPDALIIAGACTLCFTALPLLTSQTIVYSLTGEVVPSLAVQTIAFNDAAFLLVGLLSARIADGRKIGDALKQAEANFADLSVLHERILSSINSGLITTDLQGKIYVFNRAAEEITGLQATDTIGLSVFSVFGDEIRPTIETCLGGVREIEFSPPNFEADLRNNTAERPVTVACTLQPLVGASGGVTGLIIAFQDTTQLHLMEETLRRSDRLAAIGRLAAGLAHEIRNPLGSMSSALQFLFEKAKPDTQESALMAVILRESDRLNAIITDFLAYARPPQDGDVVSHADASIDVGEAINDCLALLRHDPRVLETHEFDFKPPEKQITLQADRSQIKQIFWNLLQNSIQAMPDGGRLSVNLHEPNPKQVSIIIADTGCGIEPENLDRIFEPFQSSAKGTGLGLSIVHRLVAELGGHIRVESEVGIGTKITIDLPRRF